MEIINLKEKQEKIDRSKIDPLAHTISLIGGNWTPIILWSIKVKVNRFSLLLNALSISRKMLSKELKELEKNGLIIRKSFPEVPPRVEYSLSSKGASLIPIIHHMREWGENNIHGSSE